MDNQPHGVTHLIFDDEAREKLLAGIRIAAKAVGCTMGPKGKNVIIQRDGGTPIVTKDGVTVSKAIKLKDPCERMGADLVKEAAARTNEVAGDGTTTATVLTWGLVEEGMKLLKGGYSAVELKIGIERGVELLIAHLKEMSRPVMNSEDVIRVGTISANGDRKIGEILSEAMDKVGKSGIITIEEATGMTTNLHVVEGMQIDRGYLSPMFATNSEKMNASYDDGLVLITDKKISNLQELVPVLEAVQRAQKSLLIIADEVEGSALHGLIVNKIGGALKVVAIKAPGFGNMRDALLQDLATLTGAQLISDRVGKGLEKVTLADLGKVKKFTVDAKSTMIVGNGSTAEAIKKHVADLSSQMEDLTLSEDEKKVLKLRIAKLAAGVAVIKVGGATEVEMKERKDRIEDALNATQAAVDEGILPGGGMALLFAQRDSSLRANIDSEKNLAIKAGMQIVEKVCEYPIRKIVSNTGKNPDVILERMSREESVTGSKSLGYNAAKEEICDMIAEGIIDPLKVTRTALENACSVANTFLLLDAVVINNEEDE
jgi:chaperonin GroEL